MLRSGCVCQSRGRLARLRAEKQSPSAAFWGVKPGSYGRFQSSARAPLLRSGPEPRLMWAVSALRHRDRVPPLGAEAEPRPGVCVGLAARLMGPLLGPGQRHRVPRWAPPNPGLIRPVAALRSTAPAPPVGLQPGLPWPPRGSPRLFLGPPGGGSARSPSRLSGGRAAPAR